MSSSVEDDREGVADAIPAEPDAHVISRHLQTALRVLVVGFLGLTLLVLLLAPQVAYLSAVPVPILYLLLLIANYYEYVSRGSVLRRARQDSLAPEEIEIDEEMVGFSLGLRIAGALALSALVVAACLFEWKVLGLATVGIFLGMSLFGLPVWVAAISDAEDEEHQKVSGEPGETRRSSGTLRHPSP